NRVRSYMRSRIMMAQGPKRWCTVRKSRNSTNAKRRAKAKSWFLRYSMVLAKCSFSSLSIWGKKRYGSRKARTCTAIAAAARMRMRT
ncbi:hypothetical protein PFISCL1PPCAC_21118, partial [Pristionchus fissidentatus]